MNRLPTILTLTLVVAWTTARAGPAQQDPAPRPWDPALGTVTIAGVVRFKGVPKAIPPAPPSADPWCEKACQDKAALVPVPPDADGALRDVFVWIEKGAEGGTFPVPEEPVLLDQKGCVFVPRVLGVRAGQRLIVRNSDGTSHNVQALPKRNDPFNFMQAAEGAEREIIFTRPETMVRLKCNIHTWMSASVGVLPHPFFAVSGAGGKFQMPGVPPGELTIAAWHEVYGRIEEKAAPAAGVLELTLTFRPKAR